MFFVPMGSYTPWLPHLDHHASYASYIIDAAYHSPLHPLKSMTQQKMAYHVSRCDTVILLCVEVAMIQSITEDTDLTILTGKDV